MRWSALALLGTILSTSVSLAQDSGHATVGDEPLPLSETGLRFPWEDAPENSPFRQGSTVSTLTASRILGVVKNRANMYSAGIGLGYYFLDNLSVNVSLNGYYGDFLTTRFGMDQGDFWGVSGDVMLRYHFLSYGSWSLFVDGGIGVSGLSKAVPVEGTRYNLNPMLGIGFTKQLCECTHFIGGCRWNHLSNGSFIDATNGPFFNGAKPNPGFDGKQIYAGLLFSY